MNRRRLVFLLLMSSAAPSGLLAQPLKLQTYVVTVVTKTGGRSEGILDDVTPLALYCDPSLMFAPNSNARVIPLETVRKVILRRTNKRRGIIAGAVIGGVFFGFLTLEGLKKNPTRSAVSSGITLLLGAGTGAIAGAGAGAILSGISRRVIRPRDRENSIDDFRRQLEPYSIRYQTDVFNRTNP